MLWSNCDATWEINLPDKRPALPIFLDVDLARNVSDKPRLRTKSTKLIPNYRAKAADRRERESAVVFIHLRPKMYPVVATIAEFAKLEHDHR
jgi:hypothetical protein